MTRLLATVRYAAHLQGIPLRTVYRWVAEGRCTSVRIAGKIRVDLEEIEWLAQHRPGRTNGHVNGASVDITATIMAISGS